MQQQPQLFKDHQQKLSNVNASIQGVQAERKLSDTESQLSPRKRFSIAKIFSRKKQKCDEEDLHGSRLSIDYDHFEITDSGLKRFTDSHVNPDVSFNEDGKMQQNSFEPNVRLETPLTYKSQADNNVEIEYFENDLYRSTTQEDLAQPKTEPQNCLSQPMSHDKNHEKIPVTSIDDVDLSTDYYDPVELLPPPPAPPTTNPPVITDSEED